jgi:PPOX class probable F420-dependent enzyme
MSVLNDAARRVIEGGQIAFLSTLNFDGSTQVSAVWVGLEEDNIVFGHLMGGLKVRNIERDERVVLAMLTPGTNEVGMAHNLVIYGRAQLREGGAPALLQKLARTYVGPDAKFPPMDAPPPGHIIVITPIRVSGLGPWTS